jgi:hypothetical protein
MTHILYAFANLVMLNPLSAITRPNTNEESILRER